MAIVSATDDLVTGEGVALTLRPAPFVLRAAGAIIDLLVHAVLYALSILLLVAVASEGLIDQAAFQALAIGCLVLCFVVVPTAVETLSHGRSLGRLAIGARIVRDDGGAASFRHAFIRGLVGFVEMVMTLGGLAAIVGLLSARSKRLGDLLAGTYSQHERVPRSVPRRPEVPIALQEWALTADVATLPVALSRRVAQFLRNAAAMAPASRARSARELAAECAAFVSPVPDVHPEVFLEAVAALRHRRESRALELDADRRRALSPVLDGLPHGFPDR